MLLVLGLIFAAGLLMYFKYAGFFLVNLNQIAGTSFSVIKAVLPVGISFYTFQIISYLVDVYRGEVTAQKNIISYGTYVTMFPQLIAGPIVRYEKIAGQLEERKLSISEISLGIRRFLLGLGKKILIANQLGELCDIFRVSEEKSILFYWIYAISVSLQIYFDFSGYSDMAIGLGKILGFQFPENFDYPFISRSITEFWRRWHMTLGTWFRDYIYIPLGGNRGKKSRWLRNLLIVWTLTGLWHGAAWNFVLWGIYFGVLLIVEKMCLSTHLQKAKIWNHIYVLLAVIFGFVMFDAENVKNGIISIGCMFGGGGLPFVTKECMYYLGSYGRVLLTAGFFALPFAGKIVKKMEKTSVGNWFLLAGEPIFLAGILILCTAYLVDGSYNPFLYFRF